MGLFMKVLKNVWIKIISVKNNVCTKQWNRNLKDYKFFKTISEKIVANCFFLFYILPK
jgi:hypothetical protein